MVKNLRLDLAGELIRGLEIDKLGGLGYDGRNWGGVSSDFEDLTLRLLFGVVVESRVWLIGVRFSRLSRK